MFWQFKFSTHNDAMFIILMATCKTTVSPVHLHWRYCSLALSHRFVLPLPLDILLTLLACHFYYSLSMGLSFGLILLFCRNDKHQFCLVFLQLTELKAEHYEKEKQLITKLTKVQTESQTSMEQLQVCYRGPFWPLHMLNWNGDGCWNSNPKKSRTNDD